MENSGASLIEEVQLPSFEGLESGSASLATARKCVDWMLLVLIQLNQKAGFELQISSWINDLVISSASQAAMFWHHRRSEQARISLFHSWLDHSLLLKPTSTLFANRQSINEVHSKILYGLFSPSEKELYPSELDREFLLLFSLAVTEKIRAETADSQARQSLRNVLTKLELSLDDISRLLGVSSVEVEEWETGDRPIAAEHQTVLNRVSSAVTRLSAIFRPDRLPKVIRRKAELFDGESALEWILEGRTEDVLERYEAAFAYQR